MYQRAEGPMPQEPWWQQYPQPGWMNVDSRFNQLFAAIMAARGQGGPYGQGGQGAAPGASAFNGTAEVSAPIPPAYANAVAAIQAAAQAARG